MKISATAAAKKFECLQDKCPDTCCKGWSMQLDDATFAKYKANNLEDSVAYDGEIRVMRRDPKTDYCIKFQDGICGIHKEQGAQMLGDACNFYPRVTRKIANELTMTLSPSCPEALRLMLEDNNFAELDITRQPSVLKDWQMPDFDAESHFKIHSRFLAEATAEADATKLISRIYSVANSLRNINLPDWPNATDFMFKMADGKLVAPTKQPLDEYNILQVFLGLLHATGKKPSARLHAVIESISNYLGVDVNYETLMLNPNSTKKSAVDFDAAILNKYIAAQLSFSLFPFAGIGDDILQKAKILMYKFALIKLALKSFDGSAVDAIQPISRIIDHIGDAVLLLKLMDSFNWNNDANLLGLVQD